MRHSLLHRSYHYTHLYTTQRLPVEQFYQCVNCLVHWHQRWNCRPFPKALRAGSLMQVRGAKSKATIKLKDLPQGVLNAEPEALDRMDDSPAYPTMIQQARSNMRKFDTCVLLTRVGGFYELYFEHAEEYGPLLNLKVAQKKTTAGSVSMAGFPFFQLDRFLKILVQDLDKYVAISEEYANSAVGKVKSGGLLFDRKVTRVITPGTLVDETFMDPYANNFLLAVCSRPENHETRTSTTTAHDVPIGDLTSNTKATRNIGLAWIDLSTGEFYTQSISLGALLACIVRIGAKEVILNSSMDEDLRPNVMDILKHDRYVVAWQHNTPTKSTIADWSHMLETPVIKSEHDLFTSEEVFAGGMILDYVADKLQGLGIKLQPPIRKLENESMGIDRHSMRGLEILETSRDGLSAGKGSLLHSMRRTVTKSGARLLRERISSPSTSLMVINHRLDLVERFLNDTDLRESIVSMLCRTSDSQRLVQKFSLGRGDADDLINLLRTITTTQELVNILEEAKDQNKSSEPESEPDHALINLLQRVDLDGPNALASLISKSIDEDGLMVSHRNEENESARIVSIAQGVLSKEGVPSNHDEMPRVSQLSLASKAAAEQNFDDNDDAWIMRKSASPILEGLHHDLLDLRQAKTALTVELRERAGTPSLTLRWTPGLGHICHVKGMKDVRTSASTLSAARNVNSTKSTRSFYVPDWSTLGGKFDQVKLRIQEEERRVFRELREQVVINLLKLRRNAAVLDELDLACSSAILAKEQGFVRPKMNLRLSHRIIGGRHPMVKIGLEEQGRAFVSNDCLVGDQRRIWLITGPNMAGKSTFLRQNALISILAQMGSFVPAEHVEIGIVDQLFSRVGSADNLFQDQSTFMVEMLETATILKNATSQSFVIMDEVGRGTTPEDGIAVGFACLHHLYHTNRCRTLFATHFHALADMTGEWEGVGCYCTDITEDPSGAFSYVHRLRPGVNRQSHALKVAKLAGIPESAIDIASQVLSSFQSPKSPNKPRNITKPS